MKNIKKFFYEILDNLGILNVCGCDACHFEAFDFRYFYWFKDWDAQNPEWKFNVRKELFGLPFHKK